MIKLIAFFLCCADQVGLWSAVALIVGTMIGSGIFVSSGSLLER